MSGVSYGPVGLGGGSQGTCLHKPTDLETNRSKAVLSGRRRENRYETHLRTGKSFLRQKQEGWESQAENSWKSGHRKGSMDLRRTREPRKWNAGAHWKEGAVSSKSKKPKPKVLELPGNLGEEQLPAATMHCLTKQMPGRTEDRRKGKQTSTQFLVSLNKSN